MKRYGLIGYPLGHSFSPGYFAAKFAKEGIDARYDAFATKEIGLLLRLISETAELVGLNVTIPYKQAVIPYLDELSPEASAIGAVNTIAIRHDGKLLGHNTDVVGVAESLKLLGLVPNQEELSALILGTGGSSLAVAYVLAQWGIPFQKVGRNGQGDLAWEDLHEESISNHRLIINCTPLGMYPKAASYPAIPYGAIGSRHYLFDLVYNPEKTLFLQKGKEKGATVLNGLPMLHAQAEAAWRIWHGIEA